MDFEHFKRLKQSRLFRFRQDVDFEEKQIKHFETMLDLFETNIVWLERKLAKWNDPKAVHIAGNVLKDVSRVIRTEDFRNGYVAEKQAEYLSKLEAETARREEYEKRFVQAKEKFAQAQTNLAEELKFENETFEQFRARIRKEL